MKTIRRILLILDASLSRTPAVERAVAFSRKTGASLWVGLFDRGPRLGVLGILDRADARHIENMMRDQMSTKLDDLKRQLSEDGLTVHTIDDREAPSVENILRQVAEAQIDLIVKDVGHESALRRLVFLPLDWELLRNSPVPMWMVGAQARPGLLPQRIVAAVDPLNPEHGAGPLNDRLLDIAGSFAAAGSGHVRVFTAFGGLPAALRGLDPNGLSISQSYEELYDRLRKEHRQQFDALLKRHAMTNDDAVVLFGPAAPTLLDALEDYQADALVVGTIRRRGIDRLLMGSTVERLIGEAPCDLVAVPAVAQTVTVMPPCKEEPFAVM
ncbi:universal stress protein E [Panacagrimonas perspica]|uniref:Universal stress protein E n=1 Tax=Panacagrimonas perspica TaxID=381431 RepID=A0A4S3K4V5_9GAMM|nr:universal stress protein [Panacagrimonas perspica]TDU31656.1 universal stress protein E [Panacagrimonas perspica]THD03123.1 hypothetical protein B1810_11075 [Panacagrimonas perspica]